jgi:hypothetical protein
MDFTTTATTTTSKKSVNINTHNSSLTKIVHSKRKAKRTKVESGSITLERMGER